ncbi:MAG: hypothetical protein HY786_02950 [Deltaproteobacteria bacterium]|nr:hypothetical protein [Deltaproteobacteria bacterium]
MEGFLNLILEPIKEVYLKFKLFFPSFLAMLTIVIIGIAIAWAVKKLMLKVFKAANFDSWCDRMGFTALLRKADVWAKPGDISGVVVYWFLLFGFLMIGLSALQIQAIDNLVSQFFLYLPRAFSAVVILLIGYMVAGFLSRAVLIAAVNSGFHYAKLLAEAVKLLLTVLILAMALEQLQVAPSIVLAAFSIIFGGIVIALAISFGVAGIEGARKMIQGETEAKKEEKGDVEHI